MDFAVAYRGLYRHVTVHKRVIDQLVTANQSDVMD